MCVRPHYGLIKADDGVVAEVERVQLQPGQCRAQVATAQGQKLLIGQHTHTRASLQYYDWTSRKDMKRKNVSTSRELRLLEQVKTSSWE